MVYRFGHLIQSIEPTFNNTIQEINREHQTKLVQKLAALLFLQKVINKHLNYAFITFSVRTKTGKFYEYNLFFEVYSDFADSWSEEVNPGSNNDICLVVFKPNSGILDSIKSSIDEVLSKLNA